MALLEKWKYFIASIAKHWHKGYPLVGSFDDFKASAMQGFWEAGINFDTSRGVGFATYAKFYADKCCREFIVNTKGVRRSQLKQVQEYLPLPLNEDFAEVKEVKVARDSISPTFWMEVEKCLDARLTKIVKLRYIEDYTLNQIGKEIGVTTERVRQLLIKAINDLRKRSKGLIVDDLS